MATPLSTSPALMENLHGFSTGHQLFSDGYDTALVVTVPSWAA